MKYIFLLAALLVSTFLKAEPNLLGIWDGFYTGSTNALGAVELNMSSPNCFLKITQISKSEQISFPCESLEAVNGYYIFTTKKQFIGGKGWVETRYQLAVMPYVPNKDIPRTLIGTWLQGMVEEKQSNFVGLNSGTLKLKERLAQH
jgi:hypothetical protein